MKIKDKKLLAENLFVRGGITQKMIAEKMGISLVTVGKWVKEGGWKNLKASMQVSRAVLLENAYAQILAIDEKIKENGNIPTKELSDAKGVLRKEIETLTDNALHIYIEVMTAYINYLSKHDPKYLKETIGHMHNFIKEKKIAKI